MNKFIEIDGSYGEGGGQIIRTALALSALTGKPFKANNIRKGRKKPGLKAQHIYCIRALEKLCNAKSSCVHIGSEKIEFVPGKLVGGKVNIDIGTAGSVSLLLQSIMLPSMFAEKKTKITIAGGTAGKWAMPYEFFNELFIPHMRRFADIDSKLIKRGYYPKGGGVVELSIKPKFSLEENIPKIECIEQGKLVQIKGISHASKSLEPVEVADRQAKSAKFRLSELECPVDIRAEYSETLSGGSGITIYAIFSKNNDIDVNSPIRLGTDTLGEKGKKAEIVGKEAAESLIKEIESDAPIDKHLADNIIPFLAVAGGKIKVSEITEHCRTNMWTCEQFLGKCFTVKGNIIEAKIKNKL